MLIRAQISLSADRLLFGDGNAVTLAGDLVARGARAMQLRDTDGALAAGEMPAWLPSLLEVAGADAPVQLDAALTDSHAIERVMGLPFDSIVVGMRALFDPALLRWALDLLGSRLVAELAVDGDYLFDPPSSGYAMEVGEAVRQLHFQGVRRVLFRDVTGLEPPLNRLQQVGGNLGMRLTYAGPVRSIDDVGELTMLDPGTLEAVVLGEPLYDGRIDIGEATRLAALYDD